MKAHCIFPDLEGVSQLLAVVDVHIAAQEKDQANELNWYKVLQIDPSADEKTIRKQYRKLALILHPDKNKAIGAEGAFKLISEAWRLLSDKDKKAVYDAKRRRSVSDFAVRKPANGFCNFSHFTLFRDSKPSNNSSKTNWDGNRSSNNQFEHGKAHDSKRAPGYPCGNNYKTTDIPSMDPQPCSESTDQARQQRGSSRLQNRSFSASTASCKGSGFMFHWGNHKFSPSNCSLGVNATADLVQHIYASVKEKRIKAQRLARESAVMAQIEAEEKAWRRECIVRKRDREEKGEEGSSMHAHENGGVKIESNKGSKESGGITAADAGVSVSGLVDQCSADSKLESNMELSSCNRRNFTRLDRLKEPFRCRARSNFDSSNSCDSSDAIAFSTKRLKVDV
ncbi:hypothetical protein KP509_35G034100 [Ceratopteris richardii]|nr:hypothetical protein KP509_35G034100 [Ceratopteris richardii]